IVQQLDLLADVLPDGAQHARRMAQIGAAVPDLLDRGRAAARGLVRGLAAVDSVDRFQPGDAGLCADRPKPSREHLVDGVLQLLDAPSGGMGVAEDLVADRAAQEVVHGLSEGLAADVPESQVDRTDRRHRDRSPAPVDASVQWLPAVLDPSGIAADEPRCHVLTEVRGDRELSTVDRRVSPPDDSVLGEDLQRDEVPAGARDDDLGGADPIRHREITTLLIGAPSARRVMFSAMSLARPWNVCAVTPEEWGVMMTLSSVSKGCSAARACEPPAG